MVTALADVFYMSMIGAATSSQYIEMGKLLAKRPVLISQFFGIAAIQFFRFIKLRMTFS